MCSLYIGFHCLCVNKYLWCFCNIGYLISRNRLDYIRTKSIFILFYNLYSLMRYCRYNERKQLLNYLIPSFIPNTNLSSVILLSRCMVARQIPSYSETVFIIIQQSITYVLACSAHPHWKVITDLYWTHRQMSTLSNWNTHPNVNSYNTVTELLP